MGLTQISTDGVKNDAITKTKIPANQIEASELADNAVDTNAIANNAVTAGKLASGVQTTINNNADNRVITGSGTANTLEGESGLTFDGQALTLGSGYLAVRQAALPQVDIQHSTDTSYSRLYLAQSSGSGGYFAINKIGTNGGGYTGGSNSAQLWSSANAPMVFATNNTEKVRIQAGGGISFNGDTAATNALDDYEEGTFTPAYDAGGGVTFSYPQQYGFYTKIGDKVTFELYLQAHASTITSGNGGNGVVITGLPFAALNHSRYYPAVTIGRTYFFQLDDNKRIYAYVQSGNSYIRLIQEQNDTAGTIFTAQQLDHNTCEILVSGHYRV